MEMKVNLIKEYSVTVFLMKNLFISKLDCLESGGNHSITSRYKLKKNTSKSLNCLRSSTVKTVRVAFFFP